MGAKDKLMTLISDSFNIRVESTIDIFDGDGRLSSNYGFNSMRVSNEEDLEYNIIEEIESHMMDNLEIDRDAKACLVGFSDLTFNALVDSDNLELNQEELEKYQSDELEAFDMQISIVVSINDVVIDDALLSDLMKEIS